MLQAGSLTGMPQSLARFRVEDAKELCRDLHQLDALPVRTADTVSLFYVKCGQTKLADMLANVVSRFMMQLCRISKLVSNYVHRVLLQQQLFGASVLNKVGPFSTTEHF